MPNACRIGRDAAMWPLTNGVQIVLLISWTQHQPLSLRGGTGGSACRSGVRKVPPPALNLLQSYAAIRCRHVYERSARANAEVLSAGPKVSPQGERKFR